MRFLLVIVLMRSRYGATRLMGVAGKTAMLPGDEAVKHDSGSHGNVGTNARDGRFVRCTTWHSYVPDTGQQMVFPC